MARRSSPTLERHERRTLTLPRSGRLRLAVVADTHSRPHPATRDLLAGLRPDAVLHAGDIGDLGVLDHLAVAPMHAVRGNIDGRGGGLPDALTLDIVTPDPDDEQPILVTLYLTHIALGRGRLHRGVRERATEAGAALVVCGHSHVPFLGKDGKLAVFNPGSCGPRRFDLPILIGAVDISEAGVDLQHHDCETGAPWRPGAVRPDGDIRPTPAPTSDGEDRLS